MDVYLAEHDVQAGESLAMKVRSAIRRSDAIVVLLTKSGAASAYVHQEVGVAVEAGRPVIPIVETGVSGRPHQGALLREEEGGLGPLPQIRPDSSEPRGSPTAHLSYPANRTNRGHE